MSDALTREQLLTMFGVAGGTRLSEYPFEIPTAMVQHILDTDAALRARIRELRAYIQQCTALDRQNTMVLGRLTCEAQDLLAKEAQG